MPRFKIGSSRPDALYAGSNQMFKVYNGENWIWIRDADFDAGSIVWTGQTVVKGLGLPFQKGDVVWTGQDVFLQSPYALFEVGQVIWQGQFVNVFAPKLIVDQGSVVWTGQDVTLTLPSAFPVLEETYTEGPGTTTATSHNFSLGVTPNSGDIIILSFWGSAATGWTPPTGFTQIGSSTGVVMSCYKSATGSETAADTITVTITGTSRCTMIARRFSSAGTPDGTIGSAGAGNLDCPSHTPGGGSNDYIWMPVLAWSRSAGMGTDNPAISGAPTNYGNLANSQNFSPGASSGSRGGVTSAIRELTGSSEDPGVFTAQTAAPASGTGMTIAIPPA